MRIIEEACKDVSCEDGGINSKKMWQLKKRLKGISSEPPSAMVDAHGNLVTTRAGLEDLVIEKYQERLKTLDIKKGLEVHQVQQEKLCEERLEEARNNRTQEWTMLELECVLRKLKNNKSRDPLGFANELFKINNIGSGLKKAILKLMNIIKAQQTVPESLKLCNVTSLYKNKGSRKDFENYRGIFRVTLLRSILDRLIYNDEYPGIEENMSDSNVGARSKRNIKDNIFVVNAITNSVVKRRLKGVDIQIFDAYKCFDKLWAKECFNDIFDNGFKNDKLPLLFKENIGAKVAIKTSNGITRRMDISEVIMQGTVWGSLFCTSTMDKLGKEAYSMPEHLYKYHGVPIPPLGMVDDVLTVSNVENTLIVNQMVNNFMEHKKLKLSKEKCFRIHIGADHDNCPPLMVHEDTMKEINKEKYLGDTVESTGKLQATIDDRKTKGQGIVANILSIINEIPFGKHRITVGLKLREAMLINGMPFNSEAWHGVTNAQIASLESVDQALLRSMLKLPRGTPNNFLYLETGSLPIKWMLAIRRINYLKHIYTRNESELLRKVYNAQKENPTNGDFVCLVEKDMKKFGITHEQVAAGDVSKKYLKEVVRDVAFSQMKDVLSKSTKAKNIQYNTFEMQLYLRSEVLSNDEVSVLAGLRSNCIRGIKTDFKRMHGKCLHCPLNCKSEGPLEEDTQEHVLTCLKLAPTELTLEAVHATIQEQEQITKTFSRCMSMRTTQLEEQGVFDRCRCLPGASLDLSSTPGAPATM